MTFRNSIAAAATVALLAAAPAFAGTPVAGAKLGQSVNRVAAHNGDSKLASGAILPLVIAGAIVVGSVVVIATDDDDSDSPA